MTKISKNITHVNKPTSGAYPNLKHISLDTLALGGKKQNKHENQHSPGCDCDNFEVEARTKFGDKKTLLKRARRKFLTDGYIGALVDAAKLNSKSSLTNTICLPCRHIQVPLPLCKKT